MLGCQDFCGYYEWTFHYLRRKFGEESVEKFWREAIAGDSQSHYVAAGQKDGLRGLYNCWSHTGDSEKCDWAVSLDEEKNHLRLDMRQCPSKGFLLENNLNADEDYCDHCIGWIGPALDIVGAEVVTHEHNHCGQCWWHIGLKGRDTSEISTVDDIRHDPRWAHGYLDRFEHHDRVASSNADAYPNSPEAIECIFADVDKILLLGDAYSDTVDTPLAKLNTAIATDKAYLRLPEGASPRCVLLGYDVETARSVAARWSATEGSSRPVLLHAYLPSMAPLAFSDFGLPRPLPILALLIRKGVYAHRSISPAPSTESFALLLVSALGKTSDVVGVSGKE